MSISDNNFSLLDPPIYIFPRPLEISHPRRDPSAHFPIYQLVRASPQKIICDPYLRLGGRDADYRSRAA